MLCSLTIKNVVLIDHLSIQFREGLCALTGETGAGKSILLDSMGLALGSRSDSGLVRKGEEQASVSAEFSVSSNHPVLEFLKKNDLDAAPDIILRRVVHADGRSKAYINDQPVSITLLKQVGDMLVEIHGQFDTQSLLNPKVHRSLLDAYGVHGDEIIALEQSWERWSAARNAMESAREQMQKSRADEAFLRQSVEDLDELSPEPGEEEKLSALRERLMKRTQYLEALSAAQQALEKAQSLMGQGWRALERLGDEAKALMEGMDRANAELQDVQNGMAALSTDLEESDYSLPDIDDRLFALKGQARKHGCGINDLPAVRDQLAKQLSMIEHQEDILSDLMRGVEKAKAAYILAAKKVSVAREKAAKNLDKLVALELPPLKMEKARFETSLEPLNDNEWGPNGMERVQFLVATNPGSAAGPLNKIASGGEMARFMLALKVVLVEVGVAQTLVFDEVDSGIGGATADAVGERLARLSEKRQILVVTHSPQVAARASHHWVVAKDGGKTIKTNVIALPDIDKRREEIARMLSGAIITEEARAAASKLLEGRAA